MALETIVIRRQPSTLPKKSVSMLDFNILSEFFCVGYNDFSKLKRYGEIICRLKLQISCFPTEILFLVKNGFL